jgi:4-diphosphocytidyl-2-C-methyl-D-erythritol kinase
MKPSTLNSQLSTVKAPAKINLSLDILGKRPDGYHDLRTVMASVSLFDELTLTLTRRGPGEEKFSAETEGADLPGGEGNLAVRAARLFMESRNITGVSVHIHILKRIPVCAGLGGGSSDAAAVLRVLNHWHGEGEIREGGPEPPPLHEIASRLGSDVPYCLRGGVCLCAGRGEVLTPQPPLPDCRIVISTPPVAVSTAEMFQLFDKLNDEELALAGFYDNVFEVIKPLPPVAEIKGILLGAGAEFAAMSGSGPSVFGIFASENSAKSAYDKLRVNFPKTYLTKPV